MRRALWVLLLTACPSKGTPDAATAATPYKVPTVKCQVVVPAGWVESSSPMPDHVLELLATAPKLRGHLVVRDAKEATLGALIEHLGGELALLGLGSLGVERWGNALVLTLDHGALGDPIASAILASALDAATGRSVQAVPLAKDGTRARFLVTGEAGAEKAKAWLAEGVSWGDVLVRLHAGGAA